MTADRVILVGCMSREPQAQIDSLRANGFRVEQSKAGGHFVSRTDMAAYFRTTSALAAFALRVVADNKVFNTARARAALAGHRLETEKAIDGRTRYRLERADGRMYITSTVAEVNALLEAQQ